MKHLEAIREINAPWNDPGEKLGQFAGRPQLLQYQHDEDMGSVRADILRTKGPMDHEVVTQRTDLDDEDINATDAALAIELEMATGPGLEKV